MKFNKICILPIDYLVYVNMQERIKRIYIGQFTAVGDIVC